MRVLAVEWVNDQYFSVVIVCARIVAKSMGEKKKKLAARKQMELKASVAYPCTLNRPMAVLDDPGSLIV